MMVRELPFPIINAPFLQDIKEANIELWDAIRLLKRFCKEAYDPIGESFSLASLGRLLQSLREHLVTQFDLEETYGFLSDKRCLHEPLHQITSEALAGHRWLYLSLVELSEQVDLYEYRGTLRSNLHEVLPEIQAFLLNLDRHESLEAELIRLGNLSSRAMTGSV